MRTTWPLLAGLILLPSCATSGLVTDPCSVLRPILVSQQDTLSRETAQQILANNLTWERLCQ